MVEPKAIEVASRALGVVGAVVLALCILLTSAFLGPGPSSVIPWVVAALFLAGAIDVSLYFLRQGIEMNSERLRTAHTTVWSAIGTISQTTNTIAGAVMIAGFATLWFAIISRGQPFQISLALVAQLAAYFLYVVARIPLQIVMKSSGRVSAAPAAPSRFAAFVEGGLPVCQLVPNGVVIDLKIGNSQHKPSIVQIPFAEIDELTPMTFSEAYTYERYNVGADVTLAIRQAKGLYLFLKGSIPRPTVFFQLSSMGTTLLIRGRDLFYMVTVNPAGLDEVLRAYAASKSSIALSR